MQKYFLTILFCVFINVSVYAATVHVIKIDGDINPVAASFIIQSIDRAQEEGATCLIIEMDTPGGLLESTKSIVKKMLNCNIPIIVYVSPSGAGAVSAGVFITMASHIAVMAEGTNIGAAHPVGLGGQQDSSKVMGEKVTNWASAWMRGIAEKRGRNADWAELAVRESVSINEQEAVEKNVVDFICPDLDSLLSVVDGTEIECVSETRQLETKGAAVVRHNMNWRDRILYKISNPNIAYILMILGIYGLFFELSNPGSILPGVVGGIFLILAFFALQTLPVRSAGILLILFAIILFILEVKVTSYGILSIGGIVAMFLGSLMLFEETPDVSLKLDWRLALAAALTTGAFFIFAMGMVLKTRLTKPTTGKEGLIGERGVAITRVAPEGDIKVHGEIWKAVSDQKIKKGEKIRVVDVDGLELKIEKFS
jgi:membrane-bound serine protease (ClpP class)